MRLRLYCKYWPWIAYVMWIKTQTCFSPPQGCSDTNVDFCSDCCPSVLLYWWKSVRVLSFCELCQCSDKVTFFLNLFWWYLSTSKCVSSETYLDYSIDHGLYWWFNVAAAGDHKESVLEISGQTWMRVCAAHHHVVLSVEIAVLHFQLSQNLQWMIKKISISWIWKVWEDSSDN